MVFRPGNLSIALNFNYLILAILPFIKVNACGMGGRIGALGANFYGVVLFVGQVE